MVSVLSFPVSEVFVQAPAENQDQLVDAFASITIGQLFVFAGAVFGVITFIVKVVPFFRKLGDFLEDWNGVPARPGVEARKGVMARIESLEHNQSETKKLAEIAAHEVKPNSGKSLRDAVDKIAKEVGVDDERK